MFLDRRVWVPLMIAIFVIIQVGAAWSVMSDHEPPAKQELEQSPRPGWR